MGGGWEYVMKIITISRFPLYQTVISVLEIKDIIFLCLVYEMNIPLLSVLVFSFFITPKLDFC